MTKSSQQQVSNVHIISTKSAKGFTTSTLMIANNYHERQLYNYTLTVLSTEIVGFYHIPPYFRDLTCMEFKMVLSTSAKSLKIPDL